MAPEVIEVEAEAGDLGGADDAYDVVVGREGWGVLSLLAFVLALTSRLVLRAVLPPELRATWYFPFLVVVVTPSLAALGLLLGLLGMRLSRSGGWARVGVFLNAVVLGLSLLALGFIWYIRNR